MKHEHTRGAKAGRAGAGLPALVRAVVARGERAAGGRRRGSFLVMVVGTLALLSLFAILYVSIGTQDARTRAAVVKRERLEDVPRRFAEYVARDVLGRDVLARWYETNTDNIGTPSRPVGRREASDYPSVDWGRRSDSLDVNVFFDPVGTMDPPEAFRNRLTGNYGPKMLPTDPFLASTEPTYLNYAGVGAPANQPAYIRRRDWAQISNLAPDGRFVNLFNLRNNWDAMPGVGNDARGLPRLSEGLSLFDDNGLPSFVTDFGVNVNTPAARNTPAFWTARQRGAFRPVSIPADPPVSSAQWPGYQWADADGDGMFDARWFMMADRRDSDDTIMRLLPEDDSIRYFFAARVVDLSAKINVNTATDFLAAPTIGAPAGVSPADVDLRRLLTLFDRTSEDGNVTNPPAGSYDGLFQVGGAASPENYVGYTAARAFAVGAYGYEALRLGVEARYIPPRFASDGVTRFSAPGGGLRTVFPTEYQVTPGSFLNDLRTNPAVRRFVYARQTNNFLGTYVDLGSADSILFAGLFGDADLAELLTFRAVNDARVTTNLELALGGRDDTVPAGSPQGASTRYSPLRDNRTAVVEARRDATAANATTSSTLLHLAADVRQRLTTRSGAREFRNRSGADADALSANDLKLDAAALVRSGNAAGLFAGYAEALAPQVRAGLWNATDAPEFQTLFYGYRGPELALRAAGHLAVNAVDAFDAGTTVREATLVLDRAFTTNGDFREADQARNADERYYPAAFEGGELTVGENRLANRAGNPNDNPVAPAINLFGVEPQAFLTQVTTFTVYVDAPQTAGGDDEEADGRSRISINGTIAASNSDFLYRVVAFQLTNPFSTSVALSGEPFPQASYFRATHPSYPAIDREDNFYYIEFGGRYYKVASVEDQVYIDAATAASNQANNIPSIGDDARVGEYVDAPATQLPLTISPITIPAGKTVTVYTLSQLPRRILSDRLVRVDSQLAGSPQERLRATIQRAIENNLDADADVVGTYMLARFDPTTGNLVLPAAGADADPLPAGATVANLYRAVRRGANNEAGEGRRANVTIPARYWDNVTGPTTTTAEMYAEPNRVENDRLVDRLRVTAGVLNRKIPDGQQEVSGTDSSDSSDQGGFTIALWSSVRRPSHPVSPPPLGVLPGYCLEPKNAPSWNVAATDTVTPGALSRGDFTTYDGGGTTPRIWRINMSQGSPLPGSTAGVHPGSITANAVGTGARVNPQIPSTANYAANAPELALGNGSLGAALRVGDLLLPYAVGPFEIPLDANAQPVTNPEIRWTTFSEAMAAALGYQPSFAANDPMVAYAPEADPLNAGQLRSVVDRGHLVLDRYVPFYDANSNGVFDAPPTGNDERRGLEIPAAMAVFDVFTVPQFAVEGLTRARQGTVNINTASPTVMRCLPLVSPPPPTDPLGQPWWWATGYALSESSDVGATLVAYRDKIDTPVRAQSQGGGVPPVITFADTDGGNPMPPTTPYEQLNGRTTWTEIAGIGEHPGFRSLGEALAARFRDGSPGGRAMPSNMDFLAYDGSNSSRVGLDSVYHAAGGGSPTIDALVDEYKEQLAIFNGMAASATTRSDVFAVWFVVHGYTRSDVENLQPQDPLVASIRRRFVMVVDRSNVTTKGQAAEIVLLREVPYAAE